jgi:hypothetical protein
MLILDSPLLDPLQRKELSGWDVGLMRVEVRNIYLLSYQV